jgi:putative nucleotidyltransferase with HDIG domain
MAVRPPVPRRLRALQIILLLAVSLVTFAALAVPLSLRPTALPLQVGDVAPRDLQAPRDHEYVSQVRTEEARQAAERTLQPVHTFPDPAVARQQIERLSATLQFISLVRADTATPPEQKQAELTALSDVSLGEESIKQTLSVTDARWVTIQQEALKVLEEVMRSPIREENLEAVKKSMPSRVSLALSEQNAALVAELVTAFVIPNSLYSESLTEAARQAARDAVEPVVQTYKAGETIVPGGEIITPADMEALQELGLIQPGASLETYLGAGALTILSAVFAGLYFYRRKQIPFLSNARSLIVLSLIFLAFLVGARLSIPNRTVIPYIYPLPAMALLLSTLFGMETSIIIALMACILAAYGLPNTLDLMPYYLMACLCGVLTLGPARRFWAFFRAGLAVAGAGIAMILAYHLPSSPWDLRGIAELIVAAFFNGLASASLALLLHYSLAQVLSLPTPLQLIEISRPDFALMQMFLRNAPGTYQHSLQVANLAEQAAEKIGADALLTRVGALFHDIGKAADAAFFIENQAPNSLNTHTDITPEKAAAAIIRHVKNGVAMAHRHRLPRRLDDFILEHHGTMLTRYQYNQALEQAGGDASKVDIEKFRYPGPRPRSRETALLMLADAAEARTRAEGPDTEDGLRLAVRTVIERCQKDGQLDDTQLTLRDLNLITESFVTTLRGTYHPRIQYPAAEVTAPAELGPAPEAEDDFDDPH